MIKNKRLKLKQNQLMEAHGVPVCVVFRAMGIESDIEIVELVCGRDQTLQEEFSSSLEESHELGVVTQHQAWRYLCSKIRPPTMSSDEKQSNLAKGKKKVRRKVMSKMEQVRDWLVTTLVCHIDIDITLNYTPMLYRKAVFISDMVRRTLQTQLGILKEEHESQLMGIIHDISDT